MFQLIYVSKCAKPSIGDDLATILMQSRRNNAQNGISGILWTNGSRFIQLLEGEDSDVKATFARIYTDPRHHEIEVVYQRQAAERAFGRWKMALYDDGDEQLASALREADQSTRFELRRLILKFGLLARSS